MTEERSGRKPRVVVLGGGLAALTAAYELACASEDYEITVYQMGWRLGGKVASSRNPNHSMRIEEHGIHVLFGAYENLFHLIRRVYRDLGLSWKDAFVPRDSFTLMERVNRRWVPWTIAAPHTPGEPGDLLARGHHPHSATAELAPAVLEWLRDRVLEYFAGTFVQRPAQWFFGGTLGRAHQRARRARELSQSDHVQAQRERGRLLWHLRLNLLLLRIVGWIAHIAWMLLRLVWGRALQGIDAARRLWIMAEFGIAAAAGLTRAALEQRSWLDLDQHDLRAWLRANGVFGAGISRTTAQSAPLRMVYEVVFGYESGDPNRPNLAAGTGIRDLLRLLLDRRGALAYTMPAGSAETIITPLYRALLRRNVRFEFFHRIDRLEPSDDGSSVERIHFTRQARPVLQSYDPLLEDGAWPDRPKHGLLADGDALLASDRGHFGQSLENPAFEPPTASPGVLRRRGSDGGDFDVVVLAIPVEALRRICAPLAARSPRWQAMLDHVKTTATRSVQLWLDQTAHELGWTANGSRDAALVGGYAQPFGNWADLSVTLAHEHWRQGAGAPRSVAYLCGPLPDAGLAGRSPDQHLADVRQACSVWLERDGRLLWPHAFGREGFDWARLVADAGARGRARFDEQYFRANVTPSDRYTLTLAGSTRYRIAPGASGFTGLYLAGDWTANGFDVGSVEATAMSGRLAARAIFGLRPNELPVYGEE